MTIRVLIFDDDHTIRAMLTKFVERRGHEIEVITFSHPGLWQRCQCQDGQVCADIIISDIDMPELTGLEFIENQKRMGCQIQNVGLMSGSWSESDLRQAQEFGCYIFHKPLNIAELNEWLDACEKKMNPNRTLVPWQIGRAGGQD